jgi:hypothetical protein
MEQAINSGERITMPNTNRWVLIKERTFKGSWGVNFALSNPAFLSGGFDQGNPYSGGPPDQVVIEIGYEDPGEFPTLKRCVVNTCTIGPSDDENTVPVPLEGFYATEETDTGIVPSQASFSNPIYDLAGASITTPSGNSGIV